jgi:uncharacterized protein YjbJ (UPF0337 family)
MTGALAAFSRRCRPAPLPAMQREFHNIARSGRPEGPMGWERIEGNWAHWKGLVRERWGRLTDDQLAIIGGRREQLAGRIQEAYGLTKEEADRQLKNWERNLAVEQFAEEEIDLDDTDAPGVNGLR